MKLPLQLWRNTLHVHGTRNLLQWSGDHSGWGSDDKVASSTFFLRKGKEMNKRDKQVIADIIEKAMTRAEADVRTRLASLNDVIGLEKERETLRKEVSNLHIDRDKKQEDFDRKERELEHKLGLHKLQVDAEKEQALKSATLEAKEAVQEQRDANFTEQMTFINEKFDDLIKRQDRFLELIIARLPSAEIIAQVGQIQSKSKEDNDD